MSLAVDVTHRFGSFLLEARFVSEGRLTAFFGRSGSGKTSLVNIIAGVVRPDRGRIVLDDTPLVLTGAHGRDALELVLATYKSAETGEAVNLPLPRGEVTPISSDVQVA